MNDFFKPKDFYELGGDLLSYKCDQADREVMAKRANAKLKKLIDESPVVYGNSSDIDSFTENKSKHDTHNAKLMFVEEIVKEPCKHQINPEDINPSKTKGTCLLCGIELVAEWKAK